jgi:hypothetical protein
VRRAALAALAALTAIAHGLTLEVSPGGGPLVLEERLEAAVAAWRAAGVDVDAIDRTVRVRYGERSLLGPDVPVLIVTVPDPDVDLELLVHPDLLDAYPGALVYAVGVALGGQAGEGALDPRQTAGSAPQPSADEAAALASTPGRDPADLTGDGVVDFDDLLVLAARFGARGVNLPGDLDGDGVVDARDLAILRERYTFTPPDQRPPATAPTPGQGQPPSGELPPVPGPAPLPPAPDDGEDLEEPSEPDDDP